MLKLKPDSYYRGKREDVVSLVPDRAERVLDIGCASGLVGEGLKRRGVKEVVGIELDEKAYEEAIKRLDWVFLGRVEDVKLPFRQGYFDCIVYADVLEHLADPWSVLKKHASLLKPGGSIVVSIPNIRHYRVVKKLLKGKWDYEDKGVMDSTHLRFFTLDSARKMLGYAGYSVDELIYKISASRVKKLLNRLLSGRLDEMLSEQFLIKATRK